MTIDAGLSVAPTRRTLLVGTLGAAAGLLPAVARAADPEKVPALPGSGEAFEA
ncbi:unnamed protein product, partial [marine sediment metagenome]